MIFLTGDLHGLKEIHKLDEKNFPIGKTLTKEDYLIVLGDFGLIWNNSKEEINWRDWLNNKPWTTLFVDGNHENFNLLNEFETVIFKGAKAHKIAKSIYHLKRGEILEIDNKRFFLFGGATSIDKLYRQEGLSWWKEEMPSRKEQNFGVCQLELFNFNIDFILTHTAPSSITQKLVSNNENDELERYFEFIYNNLKGNYKWYFGHFHINKKINENFFCIYNNIIRIL
ncbi:MAG: hypothetical protein ACRC57_08200 [Sarcina sp.]